MAEPKTNLRVAITGDLADIKSALVGLNTRLGETGKAGARAGSEASRGLEGIGGAARRMRGLLGAAFAGITVGALFRGILENTRESELAIGQLNASLKSTGGIAGVTAPEISKLADALASTTTYSDDAIISMSSVLATFTNIRTTVFKDAIPAILDLSAKMGQDLQSSAVQVGKALNDPIAGLTALGRVGVKFTDDQKKVIEGMVKLGDVAGAQRVILDELARQMGGSAAAAADTLAGSITQAKNAAGNLLEGDSSSGGLKDLKTAFQGLTQTLNDPGVKDGFAAVISGLADVANYAINAIAQLGFFSRAVKDATSKDRNKSDLGLLTKKRQLEDDLAGLGSSNGSAVKQLYFGRDIGDVGEVNIRLTESLEQNRTRMAAELKAIDALLAKRRLLGDSSKINTAEQIRAGGQVQFIEPPSGRQGFQADPLVDPDAGKKAAAEALRKLEALRREQERLGKEAQKAAADRVQDLLALEAKVGQGMAEIEIALKRATGDEAGAAFDEIDAKYAQLIADLKATGREEGIAIVERLINLEKVDVQLAAFKEKMAAATQASSDTIGLLGTQASGGLITSTEADNGRTAALSAELALQQQLLATAQAYLATLSADSPAAAKTLQFIGQLNARIAEVQVTQNQFALQVKDQAVQSLTTFFTDLATGAKSFKDAFRDMLRSFLSGIAQMIAQKLALKAVDAIFSAFHAGGIVGAGGTLRSGINPMVFGFAPRYHAGGIAGLAPNETAAVLLKGEEVLAKNDPRHRRNLGAGGGSRRLKQVFLFDERAVADHMQTSAGEQATLVNIARNAGAIREILA